MLMIFITGVSGFIGYFLAKRLLAAGEAVAGVDNLNDYYDPALKAARLKELSNFKGFRFFEADIGDKDAMASVMAQCPEVSEIVHLAAQAGVRYSIDNPMAYGQSNLMGQLVMLEIARDLHNKGQLKHFIYASSSSVYGGNIKQPFSIDDAVIDPVSLYAATKRSGELMVQSYAHLYGFPSTGLRFFTVYGPFGRPDMAYYSFTKAILEGQPIRVNNAGRMKRDFTYIDDIVDGIVAVRDAVPEQGGAHCIAGQAHRVLNLGNNQPTSLMRFIEIIEQSLGQEAQKEMVDLPAGDVLETYADIDASQEVLGYQPKWTLEEGIPQFVEWYKGYYKDL